MAIGKCDLCASVTEVYDDEFNRTHCAFCKAIWPFVRDHVGREYVRILQCQCAMLNVLEKSLNKPAMVFSPETVLLDPLEGNLIEAKVEKKRGRPRMKK